MDLMIAMDPNDAMREVQCDESGNLKTSVVGSLQDMRGLAANKPLATAVTVGTTYWSIDTDPHGISIEVSNGTAWVVI